ncbi:hypothetical protein K0M31_005610 [Melipona bicolor]|uniref:Uncharacterized protein n=1 Tax=Melipona bicolor TaxID=60889 RepID=A0AA40FTT5_9HYME|nr:hypothetical protein K0M31_005610 [Melipona bicolor]
MNALLGHPRRTDREGAAAYARGPCTLAKEGGSTVQGGGSLEERNNPRAPIVSDNVPYRTSIFSAAASRAAPKTTISPA